MISRSSLALAVAALAAFAFPASSEAAPAARPNILFILVDDQSPFDLKIYNPRSTLQTPTLASR